MVPMSTGTDRTLISFFLFLLSHLELLGQSGMFSPWPEVRFTATFRFDGSMALSQWSELSLYSDWLGPSRESLTLIGLWSKPPR